MSGTFGFDDSAAEMDKLFNNSNKAQKEMRDVADDMRDQAKRNAQAGGLERTGAGISGIISEHKGDESIVGWGGRPNFHLYFHELGFHALDNRQKRRKKSGKEHGGFRGRKATYVPATPHMRPAFESKQQEFQRRIQNKLTD